MLRNQPIPSSPGQIMLKAKTFKVLLTITLIIILVGAILGIVSSNVACHQPSNNSCSDNFNYSPYECTQSSWIYCCGNYYDSNLPYYSCGSFNYCYKKPSSYSRNNSNGLQIAARTFEGLSILMLFFHILLYCHYKGVFKRIIHDPMTNHLLNIRQQDYIRQQQNAANYNYNIQRNDIPINYGRVNNQPFIANPGHQIN